MAEDRVKDLLASTNKPYSVQTITDMLAQYGVKKPQVQRAVDALSSDGSITCKEFGKTKIFFALQGDTAVIAPEDMEAKQAQHSQLQQLVSDRGDITRGLQTELQELRQGPSLAQVEERTAELQTEVQADEQKLTRLQTGTEVISEAERQKVEQKFAATMEHWRFRRKIFKDLWGAVSEGIDRKRAELFEELGVEYEDQEEWATILELLPSKRRRF